MTALTKEYFDKTLDTKLKAQTKELKEYVQQENDKLARMVAKGFEDVIKRLDVGERVEKLERSMEKVTEALNIEL